MVLATSDSEFAAGENNAARAAPSSCASAALGLTLPPRSRQRVKRQPRVCDLTTYSALLHTLKTTAGAQFKLGRKSTIGWQKNLKVKVPTLTLSISPKS